MVLHVPRLSLMSNPHDQLHVPGDALGLCGGITRPPREQAPPAPVPGFIPTQLRRPDLSPGHGFGGSGGGIPQSGASSQAKEQIYSAQPELQLLFGRGSPEDSDVPPRSKARPSLDVAAPTQRLSRSPVAADGRRLFHRGPDGRLRQGVRRLVSGPSPQQGVGRLRRHRHSDTYQW
jgi:hypothetical protein